MLDEVTYLFFVNDCGPLISYRNVYVSLKINKKLTKKNEKKNKTLLDLSFYIQLLQT
jgi:hypothetical protein